MLIERMLAIMMESPTMPMAAASRRDVRRCGGLIARVVGEEAAVRLQRCRCDLSCSWGPDKLIVCREGVWYLDATSF